ALLLESIPIDQTGARGRLRVVRVERQQHHLVDAILPHQLGSFFAKGMPVPHGGVRLELNARLFAGFARGILLERRRLRARPPDSSPNSRMRYFSSAAACSRVSRLRGDPPPITSSSLRTC